MHQPRVGNTEMGPIKDVDLILEWDIESCFMCTYRCRFNTCRALTELQS